MIKIKFKQFNNLNYWFISIDNNFILNYWLFAYAYKLF